MTQIFDKNGMVHPVTVLEAGPIIATQIKNLEKDGYLAVQFGYGSKKESRTKKAQKGHTKDLGNFQAFKEYRFFEEKMPEIKVGDKFDASLFEEGNYHLLIYENHDSEIFDRNVKLHSWIWHGRKIELDAFGNLISDLPYSY